MSKYIILAQSKATAEALNGTVALLQARSPLARASDPIIWPLRQVGATHALGEYHALCGAIEDRLGERASRPLSGSDVVLVDWVWPSDMTVVGAGDSWSALVAMLVLTYPELRWHFGLISQGLDLDASGRALWARHSIKALFSEEPWDPTFDPSGLREWVRRHTNGSLKAFGETLALPLRPHRAAAIDEESDYARMHGLAAYRFGLRAEQVSTWAGMKERFGSKADTEAKAKHDFQVLFEDMSLNFPDRDAKASSGEVANPHLSDLETERGLECPALSAANDQSRFRSLVTSGQSRPGLDLVEKNRQYLETKKGDRGRVIFKPAAGMFDLWRRAGLMQLRPDVGHRGNYEGYIWPPAPPSPNQPAQGSNHGSPGKLLVIAYKLLDRAERIRVDVKEPAEAVLGAVLATDALELTGGRTPTTAIQALSLKHQFEVMAEIRFAGAEYHIALRPRLDAIERDVKAIGEWFHVSQRRRAILNAQMHIISDLVAVFNEGHCFDEENLCLRRVRRIHNTLWMRDKPARLVTWPVLRYSEVLLSSFSAFLVAVTLWVLTLAAMFQLFHDPNAAGAARSVQDAATSFFAGQPFNQPRQVGNEIGYVSLVAVAAIAGFFHLGIFISYAYSVLVRK